MLKSLDPYQNQTKFLFQIGYALYWLLTDLIRTIGRTCIILEGMKPEKARGCHTRG